MATSFCANCNCPSCTSIKSSPVQVKRPKAGTLTGQVWDICDTLAGQGEVTRKAVIQAGTLKGLNLDTIKTQYQAWLSARKAVAAATLAAPLKAADLVGSGTPDPREATLKAQSQE